jgi:hypothetical protein
MARSEAHSCLHDEEPIDLGRSAMDRLGEFGLYVGRALVQHVGCVMGRIRSQGLFGWLSTKITGSQNSVFLSFLECIEIPK